MNPQLTAQANQAAAQGQAAYANDNAKAATYGANYDNYTNQANQAQQGVADYTKQMQGAYNPTTGVGNATSMYNYGLKDQLAQTGYDPSQMAYATNNLNQANGALGAYNDYANQGASKWGLNAGGFAAMNAAAQNDLNTNIATNQGKVNGLMTKYTAAQTGANQFAGLGIQGQHETLGGLQSVFTQAANQRDSASGSMQFYQDLAQKQGGLNAQQAQAYATAQNAMASANQALAQAGLLAQQTQGAKLENQRTTDLMGTPAYMKSIGKNPDGTPINSGSLSTETTNGAPQVLPGTEANSSDGGYTINGVTYNKNGDQPGYQTPSNGGIMQGLFGRFAGAY